MINTIANRIAIAREIRCRPINVTIGSITKARRNEIVNGRIIDEDIFRTAPVNTNEIKTMRKKTALPELKRLHRSVINRLYHRNEQLSAKKENKREKAKSYYFPFLY
jgi:hypothetical protein